MDLVVDDIGVDKHDAQDAELLQTFGSGTGFKPPWHLLLSELVRLCGEMNQEYTDTVATKNLLETSPYLKKELIDAWDDKSLSTIRLMSTQCLLPWCFLVADHSHLRRRLASRASTGAFALQ
jgi:hypothetical protein